MTRRLLRPRGLAATVGIGAALTASSLALAANGTPDATFSGDGVVELFQSNDGGIYATDPVSTVDPQGRTVVAQLVDRGEGGSVAVWRVLPDGTIDPTFNQGESTDLWSQNGQSGVEDVRVVNGKIHVVISVFARDFVLLRLNADGSSDATITDGMYGAGAKSLGDEWDGKEFCTPLDAHIGAQGAIRVFWSCDRTGEVVGAGFDADGSPVGEDDSYWSTLPDAEAQAAAADDAGHERILFNGSAPQTEVVRRVVGGNFQVIGEDNEPVVTDEGSGDTITVDEGGAFAIAGSVGSQAWAFHAFTADGAARPGFGEDGEVVVENGDLGSGDQLSSGEYTLWTRPGVSHLRSTSSGGLLAIGAEFDNRGRATPEGQGSATVRLTATGAPDTAWGPGGVKVLAHPGEEELDFRLAGPPSFDAAGRTTIPIAVPRWGQISSRRAAEPVDNTVRLFRLGDPPANPVEQPKTEQQQQQSTSTPTATSTTVASTSKKTARTCLSRRSFTIRLRPRSLRSATVLVAGKKVKTVRKNGRLTATVDLRKMQQATFDVAVRGRTAKGKKVSETRTYRTCRVGDSARKVKGGSIIITVGS